IITSGANSSKVNAPQDGRFSSATDHYGMHFPEPDRMGHNQQSVGKHEVLADMLADLLKKEAQDQVREAKIRTAQFLRSARKPGQRFDALDALDASYKEQLVQLQEQLSKSLEKITELKTLKDRFADLATPAPVKSKFNEPSSGARGGPLKPFTFKVDANKSIDKNFSETVQSSKDLNQILTKFKNDWSQQYDWLNQLPIGIPVASQFGSMSSNYGMRVDPFTKNLAFHSGIDFQASPGTGIVASGYGTISKVGTDAVYGRYVEISHSDGFVSKYAHAQKVFVKQGEQVSKGQLIAEVGSTGRSTGPHLHYEITRNGSNLNPAQVLLMPRQNSLATSPKSGTAVASQ
ncbi:MAG: M23 family metallopeptidase, partial [Burkholderiaceae bacterium]|nr:M23 family metallopeptidase [Burkholderiaceae bacterium]